MIGNNEITFPITATTTKFSILFLKVFQLVVSGCLFYNGGKSNKVNDNKKQCRHDRRNSISSGPEEGGYRHRRSVHHNPAYVDDRYDMRQDPRYYRRANHEPCKHYSQNRLPLS